MELSKEIKILERGVKSKASIISTKQEIIREKQDQIKSIETALQERVKTDQETVNTINTDIKVELGILQSTSVEMLKEQSVIDYLKEQLESVTEDTKASE